MTARGCRSWLWRGVGILVSASAWLALLGALELVPSTWLCFGAAPVVWVGFALPILIARAPRESSWVKLLVLSTFASPAIGALVFGLARFALAPDRALALTFSLPALATIPLCWRGVGFERPGRALWVAAGAGVALAAFVVWSLGSGIAAVGYERLAMIQAAERSLPPTSPFLAGAPWRHAWFTEHLVGYVGRALAIDPATAFTFTVAVGASVVPLACALTFAPLLGEGRAELAAVAGALLGVGALGPGQHVAGLAEALVGDPAAALALSWSTAAGLACAHALRHGRAPWVELCALFFACAFLAEPRIGGLAISAAGLAALICPGRAEVRPRLLLALVLATLPSVIAARALGLSAPWLPPGAAAPTTSLAVSAAAVALAWGAAWIVARAPRPAECRREARTLILWLGLLASVGWLGAHCAGVAPGLGGSAAGALLGAGLASLARCSRVAAVAALALGGFVLAAGLSALPPRVDGAATGFRADGRSVVLPPTDASSATERDVLRALAWLAQDLPFRDRNPALVVHPDRPLAVDDADRFGERAGAVAALLAGLDLWCTTAPLGSGQRQAARAEGLARLFETKDGFDRELQRELAQLGRPGIVLVTRRDRWRFPWLENKFGPSGFGVLKIVDSVGLFVWPPDLAARVPAGEREFPQHHFPRGPSVFGREEER